MSKTNNARLNSAEAAALPPLAVSRLRVRNFKAIRDSGTVHFSPLTAFIGNNGVGKSSLVEALEMLQNFIVIGLDGAMNRWRGFDYIRNRSTMRHFRLTSSGREYQTAPMSFRIAGLSKVAAPNPKIREYDYLSVITSGINKDIFFLQEIIEQSGLEKEKHTSFRGRDGEVRGESENFGNTLLNRVFANTSIFLVESSPLDWQFVRLKPEEMMIPYPVSEFGRGRALSIDGSNIGEYLLDIRYRDEEIFNGIVETLQMVLPYAVDLHPTVTSETGRNSYLRLQEMGLPDPLPSWLLSTGTLRVVALLALLRHPEPPPLIVIEEIENGLDPRTIHLLVEEMRYAVENGITQIILTTHSPYLLDLLSLSQIVVVERDATGEPKFFRPGDDASLDKWSAQFTPGQLYTMGRLGRGGK